MSQEYREDVVRAIRERYTGYDRGLVVLGPDHVTISHGQLHRVHPGAVFRADQAQAWLKQRPCGGGCPLCVAQALARI